MYFIGAHFLLSLLCTSGYDSMIHKNRLDYTTSFMQ